MYDLLETYPYIPTVFLLIKDAAILILIAATLDRIQRGGEERYFRLVFLIILFSI